MKPITAAKAASTTTTTASATAATTTATTIAVKRKADTPTSHSKRARKDGSTSGLYPWNLICCLM